MVDVDASAHVIMICTYHLDMELYSGIFLQMQKISHRWPVPHHSPFYLISSVGQFVFIIFKPFLPLGEKRQKCEPYFGALLHIYVYNILFSLKSKVIDHHCYSGRHPNKALVASYLLLLLPTIVTRTTQKGKEPEGIMPQAHTK